MNEFTLVNDNIELNFLPHGLYSLKVGGFSINSCRPVVEIDGIDRSPVEWWIESTNNDIVVRRSLICQECKGSFANKAMGVLSCVE